jgi:hypothetical protein
MNPHLANTCCLPQSIADRDNDAHTPEKYLGLSTEAWLSALAPIIPGVDKVMVWFGEGEIGDRS